METLCGWVDGMGGWVVLERVGGWMDGWMFGMGGWMDGMEWVGGWVGGYLETP